MKKMYLLVPVLAIIILASTFSGCSKNNNGKNGMTIQGATNYVAYHNKHKDLEIMVNNLLQTNPNTWIPMKFGLLINEKVLIGTKTATQNFIAHYMIKEPNGNKYDLYCFSDDDIPAFQMQDNGNQIKVDFARRGFYQELCNQRAESVMQFIREKQKR